ncbi:MAG: cupin domain-containing protein [Pseudomonadota bacterium]
MNQVRIFTETGSFHTDERGWAFFPFGRDLGPGPSGLDLRSLHVVKTEPGAVRGNHLHPAAAEWLHIFGGEYTLYYEEQGQIRSTVLNREDQVIFLPPGTPHAVKNTGPGPIFLVAFREEPAAAPHTLSHPLV